MISCITGTVSHIVDNTATIELAGGIGFEVQTPHAARLNHGATTKLYTYLHWHQEQGPSLYGFAEQVDRTLFTLLISCTGVGPKMALTMLKHMSSSELATALYEQDIQKLSSISGIGPKKAEQIAVHLKSKVAKLLESGTLIGNSAGMAHLTSVSQALIALNYSRTEISQALNYVQEQGVQNELTFDTALRKALAFLSKRA